METVELSDGPGGQTFLCGLVLADEKFVIDFQNLDGSDPSEPMTNRIDEMAVEEADRAHKAEQAVVDGVVSYGRSRSFKTGVWIAIATAFSYRAVESFIEGRGGEDGTKNIAAAAAYSTIIACSVAWSAHTSEPKIAVVEKQVKAYAAANHRSRLLAAAAEEIVD